jgi:hypothetical protein
MYFRKVLFSLSALVFVFCAGTQQARSESMFSDPTISIGPSISTLGFGGDLGLRYKYIGIRVVGNYFFLKYDKTIAGIDYKTDLNLASVGGMLDIYPFGGMFRITGGFRYNMNGFDLTAAPNGSITIGGTTYTAAEAGTVTGSTNFRNFAPYAGIGIGFTIADTIEFGADAGVLFQGNANVSMKGTGTLSSTGGFLADAGAEAQQIEDALTFLEYYPVIRLHLLYRF